MKGQKLLLISLLLALSSWLYALDTLVLQPSFFKQNASFYIIEDNHLDYETAVQKLILEGDVHYHDRGRILRSFSKYWVAIYFYNGTHETMSINAEAHFDKVWLDHKEIKHCGMIACDDERGIVQQPQMNMSYFDITPGYHLMVARIADFHLKADFTPRISNSKNYDANTFKSNKTSVYVLMTLANLFALLGIIALLLFLVIKDKAFLFYSLFCLTSAFHFIRVLGERVQSLDFISKYIPWIYIKVPIFLGFFIFYGLFIIYFTRAKEKYPDIYKINFFAISILPIVCLPEVYFLLNKLYPISYTYYFIVRFITNLVSIYILFRLYKYRSDKYVLFILIGGGGLMFSEFLSTIFESTYSNYINLVGMFIEVIVFNFGLAYKVYEVVSKSKDLEHSLYKNQHELEVISNLKNEISINFLQAQMNPHFVFNALNSIKYHILKNENQNASEYLSKLASLLRKVLDQSSERSISLAKEIDTLRLYIEMEALRLGDKFTYDIIIEEELETELIMVPPLILQPFVENVFVHAFKDLEKNGKLILRFYEVDNRVTLQVEDNGPGHENLEMKNPHHQSKAFQITKDRLVQWGNWYNIKTSFTWSNKFDKGGKTNGFVVTIEL